MIGQSYSEQEFASVYVEHGIGGRVLTEENHVGFGAKADTVYIDGEARTNFDGTQVATSGFRKAVIKGRWKLVYDPDLPPEIYDLERDPLELNNLAEEDDVGPIKVELMEELVYWCVRLDDTLDVKRYSVKRPPHNWYR